MDRETESPAVSGVTSRYAWYVTAILAVAYFVSYVDRIVLSLLVEPIKADLQVSDTQMSLLLGLAFAIFYAVLGIPIARCADRLSRKWIIAIGIVLWSLATAATGLARTYTGVLLARMGVGVGEAALTPAAYSMLADYFRPHALARAMSIYHMGSVIGIGAAFIIGGTVAGYARSGLSVELPWLSEPVKGWQLAFFIVGLPGVLVALLIALTVKEPRRHGRRAGVAFKSARLIECLGFMRSNARVFGALMLGPAICGAYAYGAFSWMPSYLIRVFGASPREAGLWFGTAVILSNTGGFYASATFAAWFERRGKRDALLRASGFALLASSVPAALCYYFDEPAAVLSMWALAAFLMTMPFALCPTALQLITPNEYRATSSSFYLLLTSLAGLAAGPTLVAVLAQHVFHSPLALGKAMAVLAATALPLAGLVCLSGRAALRAALARVGT